MKALSLWEPWATFVALKIKRYETRSWGTKYRGPLLICAAQKRLPFVKVGHLLLRAGVSPDELQYGMALAIVYLTDVIRTEEVGKVLLILEKEFGDFTPGRFAWKLDDVKRFQKQFYARGGYRLFDVPDEILRGRV